MNFHTPPLLCHSSQRSIKSDAVRASLSQVKSRGLLINSFSPVSSLFMFRRQQRAKSIYRTLVPPPTKDFLAPRVVIQYLCVLSKVTE